MITSNVIYYQSKTDDGKSLKDDWVDDEAESLDHLAAFESLLPQGLTKMKVLTVDTLNNWIKNLPVPAVTYPGDCFDSGKTRDLFRKLTFTDRTKYYLRDDNRTLLVVDDTHSVRWTVQASDGKLLQSVNMVVPGPERVHWGVQKTGPWVLGLDSLYNKNAKKAEQMSKVYRYSQCDAAKASIEFLNGLSVYRSYGSGIVVKKL